MRGKFNILYYKKNREAFTVLCTVVKHLGSGRSTQEVGETKRCGRVFHPTLLSCFNRFLRAFNRTEYSQGFSIFELLIARDWSKRITWPNMPPPGKLGNIVFPRISAHAQISALPRISAHQLGQTSNKRPPLNHFQISRETNKTWFYCQIIDNLKRQRDQQRIIVSFL